MDMSDAEFVTSYCEESFRALQAFVGEKTCTDSVLEIANAITEAFRSGHKLLVAGNGGSAADAQHIAGEFISRLFFDRAPLPAIALTTDTSVLTAVGNDYGYEKVFERQVLGLGVPGDVFLGISTSGKSPNVLTALAAARSRGLKTIGFTGKQGGPMSGLCDILLAVPSQKTAIIQQIHLTAAHMVCGIVEAKIFQRKAEI
ncbi:D-sedoheptulose 7-phosphate isomerase [Pseudacidobacterium ailaaui]|uniref:D-sedoheptulose 7-phosphate isomerase n=1 Tax=Pseudacidobacterium ailaaui TaxID=1382359 RepID=UPI00047B149E|nr:D-sedoheptulose 7-phosphate isomerase [Pseudacidobacterium ailaaui]